MYFDTGPGEAIAAKFKTKIFCPLPARTAASDIQTWWDTEDMTNYNQQVPWNDSMSYVVLFPLAMCWRIFSNGKFWDALKQAGAVSLTETPAWVKFRPVMELLRAQGESFYAGLFYCGNKLKKFRYGLVGSWQRCTACKMDDIDKLIEAMKTVWYVARHMKNDFQKLQSTPTRNNWKTCTQGFLESIRARTVRMFNNYSLKKTLDAILISQPGLERVVSYWPMHCPAYVQYLPKLYPGISCTQDELYAAACHYHRQLKRTFPKFRFGDSLAQLCWLERGVA